MAYAVRESALTCFAPAAVNGLMTPLTPWTLATRASIGEILELAAGESAEPLRVCHTMVPAVTVAASLPTRASRLYAVARVAGRQPAQESLKADPFHPHHPGQRHHHRYPGKQNQVPSAYAQPRQSTHDENTLQIVR